MKHLLFIDSLQDLAVEKDSSLLFAHTLKEKKHEVYLLFKKDFYILSNQPPRLNVFDFHSHLKQNSFSVDSFSVTSHHQILLDHNILFHMRLDPPFDESYLKYLWMMNDLKKFGVRFLNDPEGIMLFNEKITSFLTSHHLETYIGNSPQDLVAFAEKQRRLGHEYLILKPLNLYQGMGIEKISLANTNQLQDIATEKIRTSRGAILAQPFVEKISEGEARTVFFADKNLGTILKVPKQGEFLANVAQGASYSMIELDPGSQKECEKLGRDLQRHGLYWFAYDILDGHINEVNVTCPGLLVEVSSAIGRNLAVDIIAEIDQIS